MIVCVNFLIFDGGKGGCLFKITFELAPKRDIAFSAFLVSHSGSERSVSVFLSSLTFRVEFFTNKLERF